MSAGSVAILPGDLRHGGARILGETDELQDRFGEMGQGIHVPDDGLREHADLFQLDLVHRDGERGHRLPVLRLDGERLLAQADPLQELQEDEDAQAGALGGVDGLGERLHEGVERAGARDPVVDARLLPRGELGAVAHRNGEAPAAWYGK